MPEKMARSDPEHYSDGLECWEPPTHRISTSGQFRKRLPFGPVRDLSGESRFNKDNFWPPPPWLRGTFLLTAPSGDHDDA